MSPTDWRFCRALFAAMMFLSYSAAAAEPCARVRTHKRDSIVRLFVIHRLRQESFDESQLFLANGTSVCAA